MSLNQILIEGKKGDGLNIECKSINSAIGSDSLFRGQITVEGISDLQGDVTCEQSLIVVGVRTNYSPSVEFRPISTFGAVGTVFPITAKYFIDGIIILLDTFVGSIEMPLSVDIDAELGNPANDAVIKCTIINRGLLEHSISSVENTAQNVPPRFSVLSNSSTDIYWVRIGGIWTGLLA